MKKCNNEDINGDNDINEDGNNNGNATAGSGSDGTIFDPITKTWSCGGGSVNNRDGVAAAVHYLSTCWTIMYIIFTL